MISVIVINRSLATGLGIGVLIVAAVVGWVFYQQRGAHLEFRGSILKVRVAQMDESSSVMVVDFRLTNTSTFPLTLRSMSLEMEAADGSIVSGVPIAAADVDRMFEFYKLLGEKFNPVLREQDRIPASQTLDRMTAFRIAIPFADVERRKSVHLHLEDMTGHAVADLQGK